MAAKNDAHSELVGAALNPQRISLYVHLPFCVSKCRYCDFNSYAWQGQNLLDHVEALIQEARQRAMGLQPQTVFLGGGTPSLLPAELLSYLLEELHQITGFRDSSLETTIEANPESWDPETARAALAGGVNRVSIGVQSLRTEVLEAYDRVHSAAQALAAIDLCRTIGFERWSADLIYAFPGQQESAWHEELIKVLSRNPKHLSCYELTYEPGTALTRLRDAGRWQVQDPDLAEQLFHRTTEWCATAGLHRYEVSNLAVPGQECLHNLAYWRSYDWIGIGAGAGSWRRGVRRTNIARPDQYQNAINCNTDPIAEIEAFDPQRALFDQFLMGLRLVDEGVSLSRAAAVSGLDPNTDLATPLATLCDEGLLEFVGGQVRATPRGLMLLDSVLQRLLPNRV